MTGRNGSKYRQWLMIAAIFGIVAIVALVLLAII